MSNSLASDWLLPITFICNICSLNKKTVNVMDFAGGTGISYFTMKPYLFELEKVNYKVIDINKSLLKIGKEHSIKTKSRSNITFDSVFHSHKMIRKYGIKCYVVSLRFYRCSTVVFKEIYLYQ